jgi:cation:H+ antiporter
MSLDGWIGRWDGIVLLCVLALFLIIGILTANKNDESRQGTSGIAKKRPIKYVFMIIAGTVGLIIGARLMVDSAVFIARQLGFSEVFIGLSIVAVGTSLPELATSVLASAKGEHDISIGNVVGSNIFNICLVIGFVGLFNPLSVDMELIRFEFPAMFLLCLLLLLICRIKYAVNRLVGLSFAIYFFAFLAMSYWWG